MDTKRKDELLEQLVRTLEEEHGQRAGEIAETDDAWLKFRALVNVRPPWPASDEILAAQDELLQGDLCQVFGHENLRNHDAMDALQEVFA